MNSIKKSAVRPDGSKAIHDEHIRSWKDCQISIITAGVVEAKIGSTPLLVDINLNQSVGYVAVDSDIQNDVHSFANEYSVFEQGQQANVHFDNSGVTALLELGDQTLESWQKLAGHKLQLLPMSGLYRPDPALGRLADAYANLVLGPRSGNADFADNLFIESLILAMGARLLVNAAEDREDDDEVYRQWAKMTDDQRLNRSIEYVRYNLGDRALSVSEMARIAEMSPCNFSEAFKQRTGMTPYSFIVGERIDAAYRSIKGSNTPFGVIAYQNGFSSGAHMSTSIKKVFGATPKEIRAGLR